MKKGLILGLVLASAGLVLGQAAAPNVEMEAVKAVAMDYVEGALEGSAERMEQAIHHELNKVSFGMYPPTGKMILRRARYSRLVELVRAGLVNTPENERNIEVEVMAVSEGLAVVKTVCSRFVDYLQMARIDGQWKIVNVLFTGNDPEAPAVTDEDKLNIEKAAMDYIEGYFSGAGERMERALHPEVNKAGLMTLPQTGKNMLQYIGSQALIEITRGKSGLLDEDKRNVRYTLLNAEKGIAQVKVLSAMFYDYLQLAKVDGQWKIINVLWVMNPDAPRH